MFAMSQQQYAGYAVAQPPRQYSAHGTSSAFSSSANPDEDWTKISDLAERRRIQNRIAQRNYRKKLKRRLEDLERRAGTSDGSSSPGSEKQGSQSSSGSSSSSSKSSKKSSSSKTSKTISAPKVEKYVPPPQFTPPMAHEDELLMPSSYDDRERSHTPPYIYSYPPPDDFTMPAYSSAQAYHTMTTADGYPGYLTAATVPCTLPSMTHFSDAIKREAYPEESLSPYMSYGYVPGMDINAGLSTYDSPNSHTPPLSYSFDHSANCSESGNDYPATPLSMPGSPALLQQA